MDGATIAAAAALVALVSIGASALPATRATSLSPMEACDTNRPQSGLLQRSTAISGCSAKSRAKGTELVRHHPSFFVEPRAVPTQPFCQRISTHLRFRYPAFRRSSSWTV